MAVLTVLPILAALVGRACKIPVILSIGGGEFAALPQIGYGGQSNWVSRRQIAYALRRAAIVSAGSRFALGPTTVSCIAKEPPRDSGALSTAI